MLAEGILEVSAVVVPATIAFGAFAAAAVPTIKDMVTAEQNMYTVSQALGLQMPGLSGGFQKVVDAVKPQVYVIFGEALNTINSKTGVFMTLARGAGSVMDNLGARIEMALGNNGLQGLLGHGVSDLQVLGNVIGNVFGIFGNFFKVMPGYAELLFRSLQGVTGAIENLTASGPIQGLLGIGLALHGAVFYAGLAATGFLALRGPLTAIGTWALEGVATVAALGSAFLEEAATAGIASAAMDTLMLANPWFLAAAGIAAVVGGLVALVAWTDSSVNAQRQYLNGVETQISSQNTLAGVQQVTYNALQQTNAELAKTPQYTTSVTTGMRGMVTQGQTLNSTYTNLQNNSNTLSAQLANENSRRQQLISIFGSQAAAQNAMNQVGIKSSDIANASASAWAKDIVELQGLNSATVQLAGYQAGQAAAAQNALNVMGGSITEIQKVTQAEQGLMNIILGGQSAFNDFQQSIQGTTAKFVSPSGLAQAAKLAGGNLSGLNQQSLAFSNTLYTQSIPSLQKLIGNLMQQSISQGDLTKVVATGAGQMLQYTGRNTEANAVIVSLINNALGPGTVSLKTLDSWVKNNSTSLTGMNSIVAKSTIAAGTLANVLQNDLNAQFQQALFKSSGAQTAIQNMTNAIVHGGTQTAAYRGARAQLIADLEKTGLSASQAKTYVNNLQGQINSLHGKTANVGVTVSAAGSLHATSTIPGGTSALNFSFLGAAGRAGGGPVRGHGGPKQDNIPIWGSSGEYMVQADAVNKYGLGFMEALNAQKLAGGGLIDPVGWAGGAETKWASSTGTAWALAAEKKFEAAAAAAATAAARNFVVTQGASGGIIQSLMKNMAAARGWTGSQWNALAAVETREAGWNMTARNPSSGAYGLAQFINGPSEYAQYGGNATTAMGQITGMLNYIAQRYGTPQAAWNHEVAYNWYDHGGILKPGVTMAYNGTGQNEYVVGPGGISVGLMVDSGGSSPFEAFMLEMIRKFVRTKGGGNVQTAFGRNK
jgi:hypothetical protein